MSDLISRSGLLESFRKSYCGHLGMENSDLMITFRSICRIINEQPTAYDADNVAEELKKQRDIIFQDTDSEIRTVRANAWDKIDILNRAIEIVKQGGVYDASDNVCEWKKLPFSWFAGCDGRKVEYKQGDYCPRCGKKIKVKAVE